MPLPLAGAPALPRPGMRAGREPPRIAAPAVQQQPSGKPPVRRTPLPKVQAGAAAQLARLAAETGGTQHREMAQPCSGKPAREQMQLVSNEANPVAENADLNPQPPMRSALFYR